MITSQVTLAQSQGKTPKSLKPALLGLPLLPQLGCTLPHPCLFLPCTCYGEMPCRRPLGRSASALLKPLCLPSPSLHAVGTGSAVACIDFRDLWVQILWCLACSTTLLAWGGTGTLPVTDPLS